MHAMAGARIAHCMLYGQRFNLCAVSPASTAAHAAVCIFFNKCLVRIGARHAALGQGCSIVALGGMPACEEDDSRAPQLQRPHWQPPQMRAAKKTNGCVDKSSTDLCYVMYMVHSAGPRRSLFASPTSCLATCRGIYSLDAARFKRCRCAVVCRLATRQAAGVTPVCACMGLDRPMMGHDRPSSSLSSFMLSQL